MTLRPLLPSTWRTLAAPFTALFVALPVFMFASAVAGLVGMVVFIHDVPITALIAAPAWVASLGKTAVWLTVQMLVVWWLAYHIAGTLFVYGGHVLSLRTSLGVWLAASVYPHLVYVLGVLLLLEMAAPTLRWMADPLGLLTALPLAMREVVFLLLMIASTWQAAWDKQTLAAQAMGYKRAEIWRMIIWPQAVRRLYLPLLMIMAFAAASVEVALVDGAAIPPLQSAWMYAQFTLGNWHEKPLAVYAALILTALVLGLWFAFKMFVLCAHTARKYIFFWRSEYWPSEYLPRWRKFWHAHGARLAAAMALAVVLAWVLLSIASIALLFWQGFLKAPPAPWGLFGQNAALSVSVASVAVLAALVVLASGKPRAAVLGASGMLATPQLLLVFCWYIAWSALGLLGAWYSVWLAHFGLVFAYALLMLAAPVAVLDERYALVAKSLGAGALRVRFLTWGLLARPIATAWFIGVAVSWSLFLPTVLVGQGRIATIATELVAAMQSGFYADLLGYALYLTAPLILLGALVFTAFRHPRWGYG